MGGKDQKHRIGTAGVVFRTPNEDDFEAIQAGWNRAVPQEYPLGTFERSFRDWSTTAGSMAQHGQRSTRRSAKRCWNRPSLNR